MKKLFFSFLFIILETSVFASTSTNSIKAILVEAKISATKACAKEGPIVAFVHFSTKPNEYLYQVEVPVNGSLEFSVIPGSYELEAVNKIGCFGKVTIDLRAPANAKHTLNLEIKE